MTEQQVNNLVLILNKMKTLKRSSWIRQGIRQAESVADHSCSLAILTILLTPPNLDQLKCLKMALLHDLPETYCGDVVRDEMAQKERFHLEHTAMKTIAEKIGMPELVDIYDEYETSASPEAQFVKALNKLDNVFTAHLYQNQTNNKTLICECAAAAYPALVGARSSRELLNILQALF